MKSLVNDYGTTLVFRDLSLADTYGQGSWHKPEPAVSGITEQAIEPEKKPAKKKTSTTTDKKSKN